MKERGGRKKLVFYFVIAFIFSFSGCKRNSVKENDLIKLKTGNKKFDKIELHKLLSIKNMSRWCMPMEERGFIVCDEFIKFQNRFRLNIFNGKGELTLKTQFIPRGRGPTDVEWWNPDSIYKFKGKILFFNRSYFKELDLSDIKNPKVRTIMKLKKEFLGYPAKYDIMGTAFSNFIDVKDNTIIMSVVPSLFAMIGKDNSFDTKDTWKYYIVKYMGYMKDFKIIKEVRMGLPEYIWNDHKTIKGGKKISYVDRYYLTRRKRFLSVDWNRGRIYYIADIENGRLYSIDFSGKDEREYEVLMNEDEFKVMTNEIKDYCEEAMNTAPKILKGHYKYMCYLPKRAPKLLGIKVLGDYLFLVSGIRRNGKSGYENKVFVYKLPLMLYKGAFYLPLPYLWHFSRWIGNYYITRGMDAVEGEYKITIYKYKLL